MKVAVLFSLSLVSLCVGKVDPTDNDIPDLDFENMFEGEDEEFDDLPLMDEEERRKNLEESAQRDFKEFDANSDGELDAQEIWAKFGGYLNAIDLFYFFTQANKRSTGTVNYQEYLDYIIKTTDEEKDEETVPSV